VNTTEAMGRLNHPRTRTTWGTRIDGVSPMGKKLYWRFLKIGARYCTHSFADCSAPSRDTPAFWATSDTANPSLITANTA
jgi:hypothetical protein